MKGLTKLLVGGAIIASAILPGKLNAQTPTWYQAFNPRNEVVNGLNSYGMPNLNNDNDLDWDDYPLIKGSSDPRADVDADDKPGTDNDQKVYGDWLNGLIAYLPGEYWRSTPSEKEEWVRNVYPIMTRLNNYTYNSSADPDEFFDSDRFSVGDFLTGNGYSPDRDDFDLIHDKYNMDYNGLFNIPIYIARVHSDDGTFNHGISAIFTGDDLNNLEDWLFLEPQSGEIREPGSWSVPFNSSVSIFGVHNFKDAYNLGSIDLPRLYTAVRLHFDGSGNREMTYLNPDMIVDQATVAVEDDENTNISDSYLLNQNFPNPFNSSTTISYSLPNEANVEVNIFNVKGQKLETLVNIKQIAGEYYIKWDSSKYPTGTYFYQITTPSFTKTRKMTYIK
ncbi:MAG: T9SS type A sorting domain-containing protein [Planctomycetia bacterium]|nr:T9SS type A sorting domain-containing protein [Planctomycetia bacterium]